MNLLLNSPKSYDLSCDYAIRWLIWRHDWSTLTLVVLKIENRKINQNENKKWKEQKINQNENKKWKEQKINQNENKRTENKSKWK